MASAATTAPEAARRQPVGHGHDHRRNGSIQANGGDGGSYGCCDGSLNGGGGAGCCIALYYTSSTLPLTAEHVRTYGGSGQQYGGPGTIFLHHAGDNPLVCSGSTTAPSRPNRPCSRRQARSIAFDQIIIEDNTTLWLVPLNDGDSDYTNDAPFVLRANQITIGPTGKISTDGQGYASTGNNGTGPGGGSGNGSGYAGGGGG